MPLGIDCGTFNLVVARRGEGDEIKSKREINAFLELPLENRFVFNMMKKAGVPLIERDKVAYVVGESAVNMAYTLNELSLKRPMKGGCLNPEEQDAFRILSIMIHSLIGEVDKDKDVVFYSVPANAVNEKTDADYHDKVLQSIFKAYKINGKTVNAQPINEALALIYAELGHKMYTGIGLSFGAGMVNLCHAIFAQPSFAFSLVNSGDWIDQQAARASSESPTIINKEKMKIDLTKPPSSLVERAIHGQYMILIERTVAEIKKALLGADKKIRSENPVDIIIAGGTSSPNGFTELMSEAIKASKWPIPVGEIKRPADHLYAVARGCLIAAEESMK